MARTCQFGCSSISMGTAVTVVTDSRERLNYSVWSYSSPPAVPDPLGLARAYSPWQSRQKRRSKALLGAYGSSRAREGRAFDPDRRRPLPAGQQELARTGQHLARAATDVGFPSALWRRSGGHGRPRHGVGGCERFTCPECWKERARKCVLGSHLRVEGVRGAWHQGP